MNVGAVVGTVYGVSVAGLQYFLHIAKDQRRERRRCDQVRNTLRYEVSESSGVFVFRTKISPFTNAVSFVPHDACNA